MLGDFVQECDSSLKWPKNLLHSSYRPSLLRDQYNRLSLHSGRLFIPDTREAQVELMEVLTGKTQYTYKTWKNSHEMTTHFKGQLEGKEEDPQIRYLFLNAAHSRALLNCSRAMFTYICTFHHILPEFADLVMTFGQNNTDDFSHTRFIRGYEEFKGIPELSRSDRQSRIAYKLFAMEESDYDRKWTMRQTAVYHSLDLTNGRTFWLILKANGLIKNRIKEDGANERRHLANIPRNVEEALKAALDTHMTVLNWSCEGWRWYITELERQTSPNCTKVTAAPIPSVEAGLTPIPALAGLTGVTDDRHFQSKKAKKWLNILKEFNLEGPQSLTSVLSKINDAKAAMTTNIRMSEDLRSYYRDIFEFEQLVETTTDSSINAHRRFQWQAQSVERLLEGECLRADALIEKVRAHTNLYDMILQADNREFAKLSSFGSQTMTERMYEIAKTTMRETSSMHVITFFTLIFLPGTFLCAFLSTPIFNGAHTGGSSAADPQSGVPDASSSWSFNLPLFLLFLEICIPLMLITLAVWVLYMKYKKRRAFRERIEYDKGDYIV